jgi:hypothetical protein
MVGHFEPGANPSGDIGVGDPVPEIRRLEEVLVDELGETWPISSLLRGISAV